MTQHWDADAREWKATQDSLAPALVRALTDFPEISAAFLLRDEANLVLGVRWMPLLDKSFQRALLADVTQRLAHDPALKLFQRVIALDDAQTRERLAQSAPIFQRDLATLEHDDRIVAAEAHFQRGNAHAENQEREAALREWQHAIELDPAHAGAHFNLGVAHADADDTDAAISELKHAVRLAPFDLEMRRELADVYWQADQVDEAINQLRQALRLAPGDSETAHMLADAYLDQEMWDQAAAALEMGEMFPEDAEAWFQIGQAYENEGRRDDAALAYRRVRLIEPDHVHATRALKRMRAPLDA